MAVLWKKVQHSWKGGLFDQALMGRSDLAKYPESASCRKIKVPATGVTL